jgi:hypothetical protein
MHHSIFQHAQNTWLVQGHAKMGAQQGKLCKLQTCLLEACSKALESALRLSVQQ